MTSPTLQALDSRTFGCKMSVKSAQAYAAAAGRGQALVAQPGYGVSRAMDYFSNPAARTGWGTPSLPEATDYQMVRLSLQYWLMVTLYRNHWLARKIVDKPARDMVKAWPTITSEMDPADITRVDAVIRRTQVKRKVLQALQWGRLYGGAGALIVIEGQDNRLHEPLDPDSVGPGQFKGLIPFDRWSGITPLDEIETDINKPLHFNLPRMYNVWSAQGGETFEVHASRILRFTGPSVPQPELQAQSFWGISVLEPVFEALRMHDNMSWNILNLTFRANIIGMKEPELAMMLSGLGTNSKALQQFEARMQAQNQLMSNQSLMLLPKDGEMSSINYSFGGVSDVYQQYQLAVSGAADMPVTVLYGRTATGLGQTNDADMVLYEDRIAGDQEEYMRPQLEGVLYPVIMMSALGEIPGDIDLRFPSIRVLSDKDKAELAKSMSDTIIGYKNADLLTQRMALKEIKQSSDVTGIGTNITDDHFEKASDEFDGNGELGKAPGNGEELPPEPDYEQEAQEDIQARGADGAEFAGIPVTIEKWPGERRVIRNDAGNVVYNRVMRFPYGFINGTVGRDGDEVDVILGPWPTTKVAYICDMEDLGPDVEKREDEDKLFLGFSDESAVRAAWATMYPAEWLRVVRAVQVAALPEWLKSAAHGLAPEAK